MSADELAKLKDMIHGLQVGQAGVVQGLVDLKQSVQTLAAQVHEDISNGHKVHGDHAVSLAELKKDADGLWQVVRGMKQVDKDNADAGAKALKEHEESHRWWATWVIAAVGTLVVVVELVVKFWR